MFKKRAELKGHDAGIYTLAYDHLHQRLYSGGADKVIASWDLHKFEVLPFMVKSIHTIYALSVLDKYQYLCLAHLKGGIHVISLQDNQEIKYLLAHEHAIFDLLYIPEFDYLVASGLSGELTLWSLPDFTLIQRLSLGVEKIRKLFYNKQTLYVPSQDGFMYRFDLAQKIWLSPLLGSGAPLNTGIYLSEQQGLIAGGKDAQLHLYKPLGSDLCWIGAIPAHNFAIYAISKSPNGDYIATASRDKTIKIWDLKTLELIQRLDFKHDQGHTHSVNALIWEGEYLISAGDDRKIMVWGK